MGIGRQLLFDSGCSLCTQLARDIERESSGLLTARSLRDPDLQALLDVQRPGWRWEPMLLEDNGRAVRVWSGFPLRLRLLSLLGLKRSLRVAAMVARLEHSRRATFQQERRALLKSGVAAIGVMALGSLAGILGIGQPATASDAPDQSGDSTASGKGHWMSQLEILSTRELSGDELTRARGQFAQARDTGELLRLLTRRGLAPGRAEYRAAVHTLAGTNALLAVGAEWKDEGFIVIHYALDQPVADFQTGTYLYAVDGSRAQLVAASINGSVATAASDVGVASDCGGCIDYVYGPWQKDAEQCLTWNWPAVLICCGASCWDKGFLCYFILCPSCLAANCTSYQHTCTECPPPPTPGPQE